MAPAKNADIAIEAIKHGADAVYIGASSHGARSAAGNSLEDIARVVSFAHQYMAKVYVTINTIVYDSELADVQQLIHTLYRIGVDALIVQDMALLRMDLPPIALHASTQCDIRTAEKAEFLERVGFSQIVLARELSLEETAEIYRRVKVPLEAFVHGALCVSYSGDCQAGYATMGRSANRGECPQICRHKFDLIDNDGNVLIADKHLLSLRDLNRSELLAEMLEAGVSSFKIEGRLKDTDYVKNVVSAYRRQLDAIIDANPDKYIRSSIGYSDITFTPDLNASFNRGYTDYFTRQRRPNVKMASVDTPKWTGVPIGKVISVNGNRIKAKLSQQLANGDGLGYFDHNRNFFGFRLNRVDGNTLIAAQPVNIPAGTTLYRNKDYARQQKLESSTATRVINIEMTLSSTPWGIALTASTKGGARASVTSAVELSEARTPQEQTRREVLSKTGDSIFRVSELTDTVGNYFIPKSILADIRRRAIDALERSIRASYRYDYRRPEQTDAPLPQGKSLTYHDNVANHIAKDFYRQHGATEIAPALETTAGIGNRTRVMTTRYCLRREFGCCLRTHNRDKWPREVHLQSGPMRFDIEFDCNNCQMHIMYRK